MKREVENYRCVTCEMFVRLPYEPCPKVLMERLGRHKLCNMCYHRRKNSYQNPYTDKCTQTESDKGWYVCHVLPMYSGNSHDYKDFTDYMNSK